MYLDYPTLRKEWPNIFYFPIVFFLLAGGNSLGCPKNAGAAGTRFDVFSQSLYVSNSNKTTGTDTLLLEFPNHPLWTAVIVEKSASVLVPLLWSRVQVSSE
jgi:hypothetical protein